MRQLSSNLGASFRLAAALLLAAPALALLPACSSPEVKTIDTAQQVAKQPASSPAKQAQQLTQGQTKTTHPCYSEDYPAAARAARATGTTVLRISVEPSGSTRSAEVVRSAGETAEHKLLDQLALRIAMCPGAFQPNAGGFTRNISFVWALE